MLQGRQLTDDSKPETKCSVHNIRRENCPRVYIAVILCHVEISSFTLLSGKKIVFAINCATSPSHVSSVPLG